MITISTRRTGTDGKIRWKISKRLDENCAYYTSPAPFGLPPRDAFKDANKIADYYKECYRWCNGIKIKHSGKILREEIW